MPRAYDQIIAILNRVNAVRANIDTLTADLEEVRGLKFLHCGLVVDNVEDGAAGHESRNGASDENAC